MAGDLTTIVINAPNTAVSVNGGDSVVSLTQNPITTVLLGVGGGITSVNWGDIGGILSNQTDLQNALDAKADLSALAAVAFSGAYSDLTGAPTLLSQFTNDVGFISSTAGNWSGTFDGQEGTYYLNRANHTGTQLAATISDFTEAAQDATGAMVDTTLVYNDGANSLGRAAISGDITIAAGSNTAAITAGVIVNADINASAAIAVSKLAALTANRAVITDGSGFLSASTVTSTEVGYLSGVTSAIQTQLNGKLNQLADPGENAFYIWNESTNQNVYYSFDNFTNDIMAIVAGSYVPYTGATTNVTLATRNLSFTTGGIEWTGTSPLIMGDLTGFARGDNAIDIQTTRSTTGQTAQGERSICLGFDLTAAGYNAIAVGDGSTVSAGGASIGLFNTVTADCYVAGSFNTAGGGYDTIVGNNCTTSPGSFTFTTLVGSGCYALGQAHVGVGYNVRVRGASTSIGVGYSLDVDGFNAVGVAINSQVLGNNAAALGISIKNYYDNATILGTGSEVFVLNNRAAIGSHELPQATLHIGGSAIIADPSTLGSELVTNGTFTGSAAGWTLGTGWAYASNQASKNANGTGTLSQAVATTNNKIYRLVFTVTATAAGTFTVSLGGITSGNITLAVGASKTITMDIKSTGSGNLIFTPSNTSRLTIDNVSVKEILAGDLSIYGGHKIREGTNAAMGASTLVAGTVTVNNTRVTANSRIFLTVQSLGTVTTPKAIGVTARSAGTSFTITSADNTDTSVIAWEIKEPL